MTAGPLDTEWARRLLWRSGAGSSTVRRLASKRSSWDPFRHADSRGRTADSRVLALHPEVRLGIVFGAVAEGKARADSDVDLAVSGPSSVVLTLSQELALALGREVDVVRIETAPIPLLDELLRVGVVVYEARPGDGAAWRSRTLAMLETDRPWYQRMRDAFLARLANASGR